MSVVAEPQVRRIALGHGPGEVSFPSCLELAEEMRVLFSSGRYDYPASILRLEDMDDYLTDHRTARKRAQRARNLGYTSAQFERAEWEDDIFAINTSLAERQGRPMSEGYRTRQSFSPLPDYPCQRHGIGTWGVFKDERLVAYLVMYVSGEMEMVSQILGHGEHLRNDVMYLLVVDAFKDLPLPVTVFYNRHDSGTAGLRYFKERLGFQPERVSWRA